MKKLKAMPRSRLISQNAGRVLAEAAASGLLLADQGPSEQNSAALYLASLAPGSRRTMQDALSEIAGLLSNGQANAFSLDWGRLRFQHSAAIRTKLAENQSAATVNKKLSALRGVLNAAFRLGHMNAEDYTSAHDVKSVKGQKRMAGRVLGPGEIEALLRACRNDNSAGGARDGAIIALGAAAGLRRAELCALDLKDYDRSTGMLLVCGHGDWERMTRVKDGAAHWLEDWQRARGNRPGALFVPINKGGRILTDRRLVPQTVLDIVGKRAEQAGVKDISPQDFRRTFISGLFDAGVDIATVQKVAGHANIATTARYDRRDEKADKGATDCLHVPYWKKRARASAWSE